MNEISDWFQNNWIDLARLLVQCAILAAVLRIGGKLLATLRASQEQIGALLKLTLSDAQEERREPEHESTRHAAAPTPAMSEIERERFRPEISERERFVPEIREREPEPEPEPVFAGAYARTGYGEDRERSLGGRVAGASAPSFSAPAPGFSAPASSQRAESPSLTPWVSAPAREPERLEVPAAAMPPRPAVSSWLQAPMRSSSGASPWRKMVRWLQAPAGR